MLSSLNIPLEIAVIDNFIHITLHTIIALAAGGYKMLVTFLSPTLPYSGNRVNHTLVKCTVAKLIIPPSSPPSNQIATHGIIKK